MVRIPAINAKQPSVQKAHLKKVSLSEVLFIAAALVLTFSIGNYVYRNYVNPPSLGDNFTYIGSEETGCYFFVPLCSQPMGEFLYFATDMSPAEMEGYFPNTFNFSIEQVGSLETSPGKEHRSVGFQFTKNGTSSGFSFEFYDNPNFVREKEHLRASSKKNIVGITDESFLQAKEALK